MNTAEPIVAVDFSHLEKAFQSRSDKELKRVYQLYRAIDSPFLTRIGTPLLKAAFALRLPVTGFVRKTLFSLFCGGVSLVDSVHSMQELGKYNVRTILDYAVEGEKSEKGFDATYKQLKKTILHAGQHPEVAFIACKMTGIANFDLMAKKQSGKTLSAAEIEAFDRIRARIDDLCATAVEQKKLLTIDAEESWIQDTVDGLAEEMMEKYNREYPYIYTTAQLYRHDRLPYLRELVERSKEKGYQMAVKLVRGAYMERERERAEEMGYPDPIQPDKASTDRDFDAAQALCIEHIDHVAVCSGTHNEESSQYLVRLMNEKGVAPDNERVWFSQLYGMSDNITFTLADAGFNAAKYLPYGPVKAVMPYLLRRAEENTAIAGQAGREVQLIRRELERRGLK